MSNGDDFGFEQPVRPHTAVNNYNQSAQAQPLHPSQHALLLQQWPPGGIQIQHRYGPAIDGVHWQRSSADNLPATPVMSIVELVVQSTVEISDGSSAPGKLWEMTLQYLWSIPGCSDIKWGFDKENSTAVVVLIMWETGMAWKSFQGSIGFVPMTPLLANRMRSRCIKLSTTASLASQGQTILHRFESTFDTDLDTASRQHFETECTAATAALGLSNYLSRNCGWIEHDASASVYATGDDNAKVRTQCTHVALLEFDKADSEAPKTTKLVTKLAQIAASPTKKPNVTLKIAETQPDNQRAAKRSVTPMSVANLTTLADALRCEINRSYTEAVAHNTTTSTTSSVHKGVRCTPHIPFSHTQGNLDVISGNPPRPPFGMQEHGLAGPRHSPHIVDVAWITMRSTLLKTQRKVAKMLNYRLHKLPGYKNGFWARCIDNENKFGVFTVWDSERVRAPCLNEYREVFSQFIESSTFMDTLPAYQTFPWPLVDARGSPNNTTLSLDRSVEIVSFRVPSGPVNRNLFEHAFSGFREITSESRQSGPPDACRLVFAGGWAPTQQAEDDDEREYCFTAMLEWNSDDARAEWYRNLAKMMLDYEKMGRWFDMLQILAANGVKSKFIKAQQNY